MKIALVSPTPVPPVYGGMDRLLEGLRAALRERHQTDLITLACDERSREGVLRGYFDFFNLDLSDYDLVITYKAPAYFIRHPYQVCYLSHRLRVFYDLWEPGDAEHEKMRNLIRWLDNWALDKNRLPHLFTVGETVSRRLREYGGHPSTPIHHPTTYEPIEPKPGAYFLSVGRLHPWKRIDLIIQAMKSSQIDCPLKIVGEGPQEEQLRELAGDDPRIEFLGKISDSQLAEVYAEALATIFPPIYEDMGLITMESFLSSKPVLTTDDAGEPSLIVREGETGFITEPTPEAMAERMEWMWTHRDRIDAMGEACREWMKPVTWDRLANRLIEAGCDLIQSRPREIFVSGSSASNGHRKIELLVTDNQIIDPPLGGGRVRIIELYRHLPEDFNTTYIGAYDYPGPAFRDQRITSNFREILTPLTAPHFKAHNLLARMTRRDATVDVTMPLLGGLTPRYRRLLDRHLPQADILIGAHPWMFPFFPDPCPLPLVYDSQNCEVAVKTPLLKRTLTGRYLASRVRWTERLALHRSRLVLACSDADREAFLTHYGIDPDKIVLAPNGVDCEEIQPVEPSVKSELREKLGIGPSFYVLFTGSNYRPNLEGAHFIITEIAPRFPEIEFGIVGGVGPMHAEQHPDSTPPPNVKIHGFVDRELLIDLYHAADLALNPMSHGSGTNIKMLDYMAAGLPIMTTPKGARGLGGEPGVHWIEIPLEEMIGEFKQIIEAPNQREALGRRARELAVAEFNWTAISHRYARALRLLHAGVTSIKSPT